MYRGAVIQLLLTESTGQRTIVVEHGPFAIGRGADNQLQLNDAQVSRRHARLVEVSGSWKILDCGSRFGTFVNNDKIDEAILQPGDRIRLGQTELKVFSPDPSTQTSAVDFRHVNALLAGLRALGSGQVLDEVLAIVLDSALEVTGAERGFILLAEAGGALRLRLARARGGITLASAQTSQRIPEEVYATGTDRVVTDLLDEMHASLHAGTVALGIRHVLCTPLRVVQYAAGAERRIGVLYLDSRERGYLQAIGTVHALAAEAAVVIENARLYQQVVEKERVAQELRIAAEIQQALLPPSHYSDDRVELAATSTPCREVGGDLFDYYVREDIGLSFAVADVAGKATSAALLTAVVQGLFAAEAETADNPGDVLTRVNRALCRRAIASRFVTAFYAQLRSNNELQYSNAGHNPPFLLSGDRVTRLEAGGTVLGLFDTGTYEAAQVPFGPGDVVVLFSDGVTEATNPQGEEVGDDRLLSWLLRTRGLSASAILADIKNALGEFCGTEAAHDDVTLMVVKAL
ncbi:MAG: hypothetical protein DMF89_12085 [Acidobacteria bacterium]|nr:MAG: hypothetical protein DMF89_12085 [Acidobacteriota bacterium]